MYKYYGLTSNDFQSAVFHIKLSMMGQNYFLTSARLGFRTWTLDDFDFAKQLWGDKKVMKHIDIRKKLKKD